MIWVWSKLSAVKWMDAWEERFYGDERAVITMLKGGASLRIEVYCEAEDEAMKLKEYWGGSVRGQQKENWMAQAMTPKAPLKIRDQVVVTMLGDGEELEALKAEFPKRHVISVPPEMAFGTGDHPTTANCLRLLLDEAKKREPGWGLLDLGTGTGLLAIAGALLGAGEVVGMDFDETAVEIARRNGQRNGTPQVTWETGDVFDWEAKAPAEVVIANLFADVLVAALPRMVRWLAEDGTLILSGILNEQWPRVAAKGEELGLVFGEPIQRGKWTTCHGRWNSEIER